MTIKEQRERRAKLIADVEALRKKHADTGKAIPSDEMAAANKMLDEAERLKGEIAEAESRERFELRLTDGLRDLEESRGRRTDPGQPGDESRSSGDTRERPNRHEPSERELRLRRQYRHLPWDGPTATPEYRGAFDCWLRGREINPEQARALSRCRQELPDEFRTAMNTGTGSQGGYVVPPLFQASLLEQMKQEIGVEEAGAEVVNTSSGASLPFPTNDDTGNEGEVVGENSDHEGGTDPTFGTKSIPTYTYSSKVVPVPAQLVQDTFFDIEGWLAKILGQRVGRIFNSHSTNGDGSSKATGLITALLAISASGGIGATTTTKDIISADDLLNLQHSVDPSYRERGVYGFNDNTFLRIRLLKDANGQYIVQNPTASTPGSIWNRPFRIFTRMDSMGTINKTPAVFGDMSHYKIRRVGPMAVFRFGEKYMNKLQVGYLAWGRMGGDLVVAGNSPIKALRTPAS